ncbi:MAG: HEAT repeat domain-containing protein [Verrucomicrobia bacterium]|nr:HEAT repeat domain-containing protein [Verrucomicrobiota bacterium]MCH8510178.1 HEAT repeat domain-containing protein [Kiritimatiellia bacterium]
MNTQNERKLCARATALGESASPDAFAELTQLTQSESPRVRRLAASALGKLAGIVPTKETVETLIPLLQDTHPQVRQYTAKALSAFGAHAEPAIQDLRDLYKNPHEKDYVKRSVLRAGKTIREALRIRDEQAVHHCRRCGARLEPDEYARSMRAFQRPFCDPCFDEVYLDRRNFETKVELQKTIRAKDGTLVQSDGERKIAELLSNENIRYRYDERFRILDGYAIRPDFYLPEYDVYIEYWGMDTADYKIGMLKKQKLYQQEGKKLISLYPADKPQLRETLLGKLDRLK